MKLPKVLMVDICDLRWSTSKAVGPACKILKDDFDIEFMSATDCRHMVAEDPRHLGKWDIVHVQGHPGPENLWQNTQYMRKCAITVHAMYELWVPDLPESVYEPRDGVMFEGVCRLKPKRKTVRGMFDPWDAVCGISKEICATIESCRLDSVAWWTPDSVDTAVFRPGPKRQKRDYLRTGFLGSYHSPWSWSADFVKGRSLVQEACRRADLGFNMHYRGSVSALKSEDVPAAVREWDFYVGFSVYEGCCLPVIEAAASGLPIVMHKMADWPLMVQHGVSGWLIDRKVEDLTEVFEFMKELPSEVWESMGCESRKLAETWWDGRVAADQLCEVWEHLLDNDSIRINEDESMGCAL